MTMVNLALRRDSVSLWSDTKVTRVDGSTGERRVLGFSYKAAHHPTLPLVFGARGVSRLCESWREYLLSVQSFDEALEGVREFDGALNQWAARNELVMAAYDPHQKRFRGFYLEADAGSAASLRELPYGVHLYPGSADLPDLSAKLPLHLTPAHMVKVAHVVEKFLGRAGQYVSIGGEIWLVEATKAGCSEPRRIGFFSDFNTNISMYRKRAKAA